MMPPFVAAATKACLAFSVSLHSRSQALYRSLSCLYLVRFPAQPLRWRLVHVPLQVRDRVKLVLFGEEGQERLGCLEKLIHGRNSAPAILACEWHLGTYGSALFKSVSMSAI